ncbi:MAG: dockerin type I domain-containing protein [Candidatus Zixiibacteriota bacterium]
MRALKILIIPVALTLVVTCLSAYPVRAVLAPCYEEGHEFAMPGDVNGDCRRNLVDVMWVIRHVFVPPQDIIEVSADLDCNRQIDATDLAMLVDFCFAHAPELLPCP